MLLRKRGFNHKFGWTKIYFRKNAGIRWICIPFIVPGSQLNNPVGDSNPGVQ